MNFIIIVIIIINIAFYLRVSTTAKHELNAEIKENKLQVWIYKTWDGNKFDAVKNGALSQDFKPKFSKENVNFMLECG